MSAELLLGWKRYEKARKLTPRQWSELHMRNVDGENFDEMIDALPEPSTPTPPAVVPAVPSDADTTAENIHPAISHRGHFDHDGNAVDWHIYGGPREGEPWVIGLMQHGRVFIGGVYHKELSGERCEQMVIGLEKKLEAVRAELLDARVRLKALGALSQTTQPQAATDTWGDTIKHLVSLDHDDFLAEAKRILNATPTAATPAAPSEAADAAMTQWASHWFGPDADEAWIAQALANLPRAALAQPAPVAAPAGHDSQAVKDAATIADLSLRLSQADQQHRMVARLVAAPAPDVTFPNVDGKCNCVLYPNGETKPCAVCSPIAAPAPASEAVALLQEAVETIDTLPGYPKGADLCDRIEQFLAAPSGGESVDAMDAARYRWLRDQADPDSEQAHCAIHKTNDWGKWVNEWLTGAVLDDHIDAALKTAPPQAGAGKDGAQ